MRVFIAGVDGYLGWALGQYLAGRGHEVGGCDNFMRRAWVAEMGSQSATAIHDTGERLAGFEARFAKPLVFFQGDLCDHDFAMDCMRRFRPDAIVHLAEMPSAPYSMMDAQHCLFTHHNNLTGTLNLLFAMRDVVPHAHLVKLGTMGEYGTPNIDIPEGFFDIEFRGRKDRLPFPRQANSWYHQTKVHDSNNIAMACRLWGLNSTDIMQGVVFGTHIDEMGGDTRLCTRFDFDQCFGTVINRFCAQAVVGMPLTPYGSGGQRRSFLPLRDCMQCCTVIIENPPAPGEYRVVNQFQDVYGIGELAEMVQSAAASVGLEVKIRPMENPRDEPEAHYYNPDRQTLIDLGYTPNQDVPGEIVQTLRDLLPHRARIAAHRAALRPDVRWDGSRRAMAYVSESETAASEDTSGASDPRPEAGSVGRR